MVGRRGFLAISSALAAGAGLRAGNATHAGAQTQTVWFLDPEHGMAAPGTACPIPHQGAPTCHGCAACHSHATNKLFSNSALANATRAHTRCKCLVASMAVTEREYITFFGPLSGPLHRDEFDRRRDQVFLPSK